MVSEQYKALVREAFIKPIRSVLIVDDDYPTYDEILASQIELNKDNDIKSTKNWYNNPEQVKTVIEKFRMADQPLLVDIHDGSNVSIDDEVNSVKHLHQSDMLVLDYQLDPNDRDDGSKAIQIARNVMKNDHFNLIVVHTSANLERVFQEMLLGLLGKADPFFSQEEQNRIVEKLETADDENEGFTENLKNSISNEHYLHFRWSNCSYPTKERDGAPSFAEFEKISAAADWTEADKQAAFKWALHEREKELEAEMNVVNLSNMSWSSGQPMWIWSDSGFICFSNKMQGVDLLDELLSALIAWQPRPSRLFLSKLRAQIEQFGVAAESNALGNNHVLAHWYHRLLNENGAARDYYVAESVSRHSEQLLDFILPQVTEFAGRLVQDDADRGQPDAICKGYFNVDLTNQSTAAQAKSEHNAFVCCKNIEEDYHLATGHVFKTNDDCWICLTPLCDLEPGQQSTARYGDIGNMLPFTAVRLQSVPQPFADANNKTRDKWNKLVTSNRLIFLPLDGSIETYCISTPDNEGSMPHWFTLYAKNQGSFDNNSKSFEFYKMELARNNRPVLHSHRAKVVVKLRYEYSLNLMQKLGVSMTRVGLDFVKPLP